jgi:hypothetical protein
MAKNRAIYFRGVSRKAQRNAPPTELGEGSGGGPPWLLLALAVLLAIAVTLYAFHPLDVIPQVVDRGPAITP